MVFRKLVLAAFLAVVVFLPRVLDLGLFLTHDEEYIDRWTARSVTAIAEGRWGEVMGSTSGAGNQVWARTAASTLEWLWLRAQGQNVTLAEVASSRPDFDHLPGAVLCALAVLAVYPFARVAFDRKTACVAVGLLALDPFLLAESRAIRMEGGYSVFVVLTLVALAAYVRTAGRRYLVWTGVWFAGAIICKISALSLLPLALVVLLIAARRRSGVQRPLWFGRGVTDALILAAVGAVAFSVLWPRLWAEPLQGAQDLYELVHKLAVAGKHMDFFFLGQLWDTTLPPTYYLFVILFKTTPLVWLGLGCLAYAWVIGWRRRRATLERTSATPSVGDREGSGFWGGVLILLGFAVYYVSVMALGSFKQERYMICVVAALDVAAAAGLVWAGDRLWAAWRRRGAARPFLLPALAATALFAVGQVLPATLSHPYYYSYYNPLLGGAPVAYRLIQVGAGEGLDQAMHHLNQLPQPEQQTVVCGTNEVRCTYASSGQQILKQETLNYTDAGWVSADHVVTYVFQQQRGDYPPGLLNYLARHTGIEKVVTLGGLDYAAVYRAPHAQHVAASYLPGVATLLGYSLESIHVAPGRPVRARLYLQSDGFADQQIYLRLDDADGRVWAQAMAHIPPDFDDLQTRGTVFEATADVLTPLSMPGGLYFLKMGVLSAGGDVLIGTFDLPSDGDDVVIEAATSG